MKTIFQYIEGEKHLYKKSEIAAFHAVRQKTESQSILAQYQFSKNFRYIFSIISWSLYIPFFLDLIFKSESSMDITIIVTAFLILTSIEITLLVISKWWYEASFEDQRAKKTYLKKTLYFLSIVSILLSCYSGISGIISSDKSETKILTEFSQNSDKLRTDYFSIIESNNDKIEKNNELIASYSGIALTKPAQKYIYALQAVNEKLELKNDKIRQELNVLNSKNENKSNDKIWSANSKKWMFAGIFGLAGILMVFGIHYCAFTIAKFSYLAGLELKEGKILDEAQNDLKKALEVAKKENTDIANIKQNFNSVDKKKAELNWELLN
jgi:hypothetical protein